MTNDFNTGSSGYDNAVIVESIKLVTGKVFSSSFPMTDLTIDYWRAAKNNERKHDH